MSNYSGGNESSDKVSYDSQEGSGEPCADRVAQIADSRLHPGGKKGICENGKTRPPPEKENCEDVHHRAKEDIERNLLYGSLLVPVVVNRIAPLIDLHSSVGWNRQNED